MATNIYDFSSGVPLSFSFEKTEVKPENSIETPVSDEDVAVRLAEMITYVQGEQEGTVAETVERLETLGQGYYQNALTSSVLSSMVTERGAALEVYLDQPDNPEAEELLIGTDARANGFLGVYEPDVDTGVVEEAFLQKSGKNLTGASREYLRRNLLLQKALQNASEDVQASSTFDKVGDWLGVFAQDIVPFYKGASRADDLEDSESSWWRSTNAKEQWATLLAQPPEVFNRAFPTFLAKVRESASLAGENDLSYFLELEGLKSRGESHIADDAFAAFDAATLGLSGVSKVLKAAKSSRSTAQLAQAVGGETPSLSQKSVEANPAQVLPSSLSGEGVSAKGVEEGRIKPHQLAEKAQPPESVVDEITSLNEGVDLYTRIDRGEVLSPVDLERAVNTTKKALLSELSLKKAVADERVLSYDVRKSPEGLFTQEIILGKANGEGYTTKKGATAALKRLGREGSVLQTEENGRWFLSFQKAVPTANFANDFKSLEDFGRASIVGRFVSSPAVSSNTTILAEYKRALSGASRISEEFLKPKQKLFRSLKSDVKASLESVVSKLRDEGSADQGGRTDWYDRGEFSQRYRQIHGSDANLDKAWEAYLGLKEVSDLDYFIRNEVVRKKMVDEGWQEVHGVEEYPIVGKDVTSSAKNTLKDFETVRVLDKTTNTIVKSGDELEQSLAADKALKVFRLKEPLSDDVLGPVNYVVSRGKMKDLESQQIGYKPGGHRVYEGDHFVKQDRTFSPSEEVGSSKTFVSHPITHIVAKSPARAREWAETMNAIRSIVKEVEEGVLDVRVADKQIEGMSPSESILSVADYTKAVREGDIVDNTFEVVKSGDPVVKPQLGRIPLVDADEKFDSVYLHTSQGRYQQKRSKFLNEETGAQADVLSPFGMLENTISTVVRNGVFNNFRRRSVDSYLNFLRKNPEAYEASSASSLSLANNVEAFHKIELNPRYEGYQRLSAQRDVIERLMGVTDSFTNIAEVQKRRILDFALGSKEGKVLTDRRIKKLSDITSDPIGTMRGLVFDQYLGLLNVDQLFVQTQTLLAIDSIAPGKGLKSHALWPVILSASGGFNPTYIKNYAKRTKLLHGMEPEEVVTMVRAMRESGWTVVDSNLALLDYTPTSSVGVRGVIENAREKGRVFFYTAERMNRAHAYSVSWMRFKERFPGKDPVSDFGKSWILDDADRLAMSMTSASQAMWNKGPAALVTQFLTYSAHLMESILPASLGGTTTFTSVEKSRLAAGQLLLYGTAGVPIAGYVLEQAWEAGRLKDPNDPELLSQLEEYKILTQGLEDALIRNILGIDSDISARAGVGSQLFDLYKSLREDGGVDVYKAPAVRNMSNLAQGVSDVLTIAAASNGDMGQVGDEFWDFLRNIKTLDNATKAYMSFNAGKYYSRSGKVTPDISREEAIAIMVGWGPSDQRTISKFLVDKASQVKLVDGVQRLITEQFNEAVYALEQNDREKYLAKAKTINSLVLSLPLNLRKDLRVSPDQKTLLDRMLSSRLTKERDAISLLVQEDRTPNTDINEAE